MADAPRPFAPDELAGIREYVASPPPSWIALRMLATLDERDREIANLRARLDAKVVRYEGRIEVGGAADRDLARAVRAWKCPDCEEPARFTSRGSIVCCLSCSGHLKKLIATFIAREETPHG